MIEKDDLLHPLERRDYTRRFVMNGRSGTKWTWGILSWDRQDHERWNLLPDRRDVYDALSAEGLSALPEGCWIKVVNTGKLPDIIWTGAGIFCFVSKRLLNVLDENQVAGYQSVALELRPKRDRAVHGYSLLYFDDVDSDDIRPYPPGNRFSDRCDVSERLRDMLVHAGVTDVESEDAVERTRRALATL